jgi:hypothetical protein
MRFMMLIKANKDYEAGIPPRPQLMAAMGKFAEEMTRAGVLLASEGLLPSSSATKITYANGKRSVIDGPFAETKELVGGFGIVRAKSRQEAIELANRVVEIHIEAGISEFEMEIRPLADFPPPP